MNGSSKTETSEVFWRRILLMVALAAALFASIDVIPQMFEGASGAILTVVVGGVFLYYFGKQTGLLIAGTEA